jgi:hypothetical protein
MAIEPNDGTTAILAPGQAHENIIVLSYGTHFLDELSGLAQAKTSYDIVIVDSTAAGFLYPAKVLIEAARQAKKMLAVGGALVFVKVDKAVAYVKEALMGQLSFHVFDTHAELYDYSPSLARHVQQTFGKGGSLMQESTDLSEQVLMSSVPVLTAFGIKLKAGMESTRRRNQVLGMIDNHTPLSNILHRLLVQNKLSQDELLEEMRSLEQVRAIFPIFAKVPFLVHCFRNKIPFKLKDYLLASRLITQDQLDEIVFEQQSMRGKPKLSLGAMAVSKGYITTRQLEVALQDQAFYGQAGEPEKVKLVSPTSVGETTQVQSLVGHLGTTDPAGLLQSLGTNRETGVLSVENKDLQFRALYDQGKITHAKLGRMKSNNAVIEFVSSWSEGIFVFIQRQPPEDLSDEACKLSRPLDKLLLDSALAQDNLNAVWKKLPKGANTSLEKLPDTKKHFESGQMVDLQEKTPLTPRDLEIMQRLWKALDGLTPVVNTIRFLGDVPTWEAAVGVDRLLHYGLVSVPAMDVSAPLNKFQQIALEVSKRVGLERNLAMLRLSLQAAQGYSVRARMFTIGSGGEVGIDLAAARSAGISLSAVIKDLEDWQVKYIEYVSQELDRQVLRDIVYSVHNLDK